MGLYTCLVNFVIERMSGSIDAAEVLGSHMVDRGEKAIRQEALQR